MLDVGYAHLVVLDIVGEMLFAEEVVLVVLAGSGRVDFFKIRNNRVKNFGEGEDGVVEKRRGKGAILRGFDSGILLSNPL